MFNKLFFVLSLLGVSAVSTPVDSAEFKSSRTGNMGSLIISGHIVGVNERTMNFQPNEPGEPEGFTVRYASLRTAEGHYHVSGSFYAEGSGEFKFTTWAGNVKVKAKDPEALVIVLMPDVPTIMYADADITLTPSS